MEQVRNIEALDQIKLDKWYITTQVLTHENMEEVLNDEIWGPFNTLDEAMVSEHYADGKAVYRGDCEFF